MPSIAHKADFKAAAGNYTLLLSVRHVLHSTASQNDDTPSNTTAEVIAQNPLLFTVSGSKDGILATHDELVTSKTTNHLLQFLRKNAPDLGLDTVSGIAISQARDNPGFTVSLNAGTTGDLTLARPKLESLHLDYSWMTRTCDRDAPLSDLYDHLFSKDLTLPLQTLVDDVVDQFVKNSLVKRYPFVFGPLARQFNNEVINFQPIITSIKRIFKRSPDPGFRAQCGQLIKLLKHPYSFDFDLSMENHDRSTPRRKVSTEAAFYLAMQCVFKAGMKSSVFKGTPGFMIDAEEHELLETGPPKTLLPPASAVSLASERLLLDQDEENADLGRNGDISHFEMPDFAHLDFSLGRFATSIADNILFGEDMEEEYNSLDMHNFVLSQKAGDGGISIDTGDSDKDEFQEMASSRHADSAAVYYSEISVPQRVPENLLGINYSSLSQTRTRFCVENHLVPTRAERAQGLGLCRLLNLVVGHDVQQARSGDTGTSQEKGYVHHMVYPAQKWTQVAPCNDSMVTNHETPGASEPLKQEHLAQVLEINSESLLGMDTDSESNAVPHAALQESSIHLNTNLFNPVFHLEDFHDVLSEGGSSDKELDMSDLGDCAKPSKLHYVNCITDEDLITNSPITQSADSDLGVELFELLDQQSGPEEKPGCGPSEHSHRSLVECLGEGQGKLDGWVDNESETEFIELVM